MISALKPSEEELIAIQDNPEFQLTLDKGDGEIWCFAFVRCNLQEWKIFLEGSRDTWILVKTVKTDSNDATLLPCLHHIDDLANKLKSIRKSEAEFDSMKKDFRSDVLEAIAVTVKILGLAYMAYLGFFAFMQWLTTVRVR